MHLMNGGPKSRFMDRVGVRFRNATFVFDTAAFRARKLQAQVSEALEPVGGHADVQPFNVKLELCDGHRVHIRQMKTLLWQHADGTGFFPHSRNAGPGAMPMHFFHLDVSVQVPGCHNAFDGALGQTYQCRFAPEHGGSETFRFDHAQEETFRLDSLLAPSGAFDADAPCLDAKTVFGTDSPALQGGSMMDAQ